MINVGLIGYGKAGRAVANVLANDPLYALKWVLRKSAKTHDRVEDHPQIPIRCTSDIAMDEWLDRYPVDAVVDFSDAQTMRIHGSTFARRGVIILTAISNYDDNGMRHLRELGNHTRVLCSPNITLGINFLMMAAKLLRSIAPFADVEVIEQHFRDKPEVSGTARKLAQSLQIENEKITSLRLGGIVGHHEVIFGFPHQTVRIIHESIRREAFGTGAAFALAQLIDQPVGFYTFEELLEKLIRAQLVGQNVEQAPA
jgi:4-hydroxy-tetrahydrodipicolinate reductase